MITHHLKVTTLSPLCIGTGNTLSPYADYVIIGKTIYYTDQNNIKQKLTQNPDLISEFVAGVTNGMDNNRSEFNLNSFLRDRLKIDITQNHRLKLPCSATGKKQLSTIIKNAGLQPYIPGSTLKGAIKTAFLYNWLIKKENPWCENYLQNLENPHGKAALEKELEDKYNSFVVAVSDSDNFAKESMEVIDIKRLHLKKGNFIIPQVWEAVSENATTEIRVKNAGVKVGKTIELYDWDTICEKINKYANDANIMEWEILDEKGKKIRDNEYYTLVDFYEEMSEKTKCKSAAYLRIGSGKGYFYNSVGLAIYDKDESENKKDFVKFLKQSGFGKVYKTETRRMEEYDLKADEFPITRFLEFNNKKPLGWIELKIK